MKGLLKRFAYCLTAVAFVTAAACSDDNPDHTNTTPPDPPGPGTDHAYAIDIKATSALAEYGGDFGGIHGYYLALADVKLETVDPVAVGAGNVVVFEMYSATGADDMFPEGTYTLFDNDEEEPVPPCFIGGISGYYTTNADGEAGEIESLSAGTVTVSGSGTSCKIEVLGQFTDGRKLRFTYSGAIEFAAGGGDTPDIPMLEENVDATFTTAIGTYLGVHETKGTDLYNLTLYTGELQGSGWNQLPADVGGLMLQLTLFTSASEEDYRIESGTYTVNDSGNKGTWLAGFIDESVYWPNGTYLEKIQEDYDSKCLLAATGTIRIEQSGENYTVTVDLTSDTGYKITGTYTGAVDFYDRNQSSGPGSTLEADYFVHLSDAPATASYFGDYYDVGADNWYIEIGSFEPGTDNMQLDLNAPKAGYSGALPEGTFIVAETLDEAEGFQVIPGMMSETGELAYSWYVGDIKEDGASYAYAPAKNGTVTITKAGDEYTIEIDLYDDHVPAFNFYSSWSGKVEVANQSQAAPAKMRRARPVPADALLKAAANAPARRSLVKWYAAGK